MEDWLTSQRTHFSTPSLTRKQILSARGQHGGGRRAKILWVVDARRKEMEGSQRLQSNRVGQIHLLGDRPNSKIVLSDWDYPIQ